MNQILRNASGAALQQRLDAARAHSARSDHGQALALLLPILKQDPENLTALDLAAVCYVKTGDGATAAKLLEIVVDRRPDLPRAWAKLAGVRATCGDKAGAAEAYEKALALAPDQLSSLVAYNHLSPFPSGSARAEQLRAVASSAESSDAHRIAAHFALGLLEDRAGRTDVAFSHYNQAHHASPSGYNAAFQDQRVEGQLAAPWQDAPDIPAQGGPAMLFITGMPRSGTTLLENCLSRHSMVASIGESTALSATAMAVRRHVAQKHGDPGWWNWAGRLTADEVAQFRQFFLQKAFGGGVPQEGVVVDKMPLNCFDMGLARLLLPEARFLFISRHPLDLGLSNYFANFAAGNRFASRLETIGHMTRCVYRSVQDYQHRLGDVLRVQSYEALVNQPEEQLRAVLGHAGLPWEEACLSPQDNSRAVMTASLMQVRDAISNRSVGKWRRYEKQLEPLKAALGGQDWLETWQRWDSHAAQHGGFGSPGAGQTGS